MLAPSSPIGSALIELIQVDSTNNYATGLVHEGMAQHGMVVIAEEQTKGKGQRHKSWDARKSENITMSVIIEPKGLVLSESFYLSMAVANAVHDFFREYAGEETKIKWPNDLYWRDRKAGGILIENIVAGSNWRFAIVGIGININQEAFENLQQATSLKLITGKTYVVKELVPQLCKQLESSYQKLISDKQSVFNSYQSILYKKELPVRLKKNSRVFDAIIKGVSTQGELITEHGMEERFAVGEVEWIFEPRS